MAFFTVSWEKNQIAGTSASPPSPPFINYSVEVVCGWIVCFFFFLELLLGQEWFLRFYFFHSLFNDDFAIPMSFLVDKFI